ncbi:MAG TPA: hypothetical protein VK815_18225 [Candidatus Acidoferrales bacterium]|jgi:hypothetical protein|nr:hypothetical protein [Candidatus Acidoferrales bacterium]
MELKTGRPQPTVRHHLASVRRSRGAAAAWRFGRRRLFFLLLVSLSARAAENFGDVSVEPHAIYTGNTFHGYAEMRINLENHSSTKSHLVTLVYPETSWNNGNNISRLSRSVKLEAGAREVVTLLQPPLPSQGNSSIRVDVDNRTEGEVHAPNANNHCSYYSRGGLMATVFVSRSLDYDAVEHLFQANSGAYTASKAVGPPDTRGFGMQADAWVPNTRSRGSSNWLELDYSPTQTVNSIIIYSPEPPTTTGSLTLIGASGTNLTDIPLSSGRSTSTGSGYEMNYSFVLTKEPVQTVRLDFGKTPPYRITVDAVQISGPAGGLYASSARASSDNSASAPTYSGGSADAVGSLRAESPVAEWSENWLAYSPFDAVIISAADLASMPPPVIGALGDYLSVGGNVIIGGKADLPAAWHPSQKTQLFYGTEYAVGFGRCYSFIGEGLGPMDAKSTELLRLVVRDAAHYWQGLPSDSGTANSMIPVVEDLKIPTRGIVLIMLAFIIVIGPVNIIYLSRRKRRTWMLWTIPVISLVTTLLVFVYSLLREGITPDARIVGLTVIDQVSHHVATVGATGFYCPLTPSGGLNFDFATEATPLVEIGYGSGASREVDWSQSQHFTHGWVSARVPAHFHLRKPETRRENLQLITGDGKPEIVNSLGAPIKSLWIADANMNIYRATGVAAGQKAGLIAAGRSSSPEKTGPAGLLRDVTFAARPEQLAESAGNYLQPNTYIAVLEGNPFIENALGSAASPKRTKSSAIVFGILETPETK